MLFKHKRDKDLYFLLHPLLIMVIGDMNLYCHDNNLPFVITETVTTLREDKKLKRISSSHRTNRALDLSVNGWDGLEIKDFINHYNEKYKDIASISSSDNESRMVVYHDNSNGLHFHIALHSKYSIK